jgi:hypothetical protein
MHVWLRRTENTVPCMPCRVVFPSSSNAWKELESCSSCVSCTQHDKVREQKVCPGNITYIIRPCPLHCPCFYPCPEFLSSSAALEVAPFLPSFLNLLQNWLALSLPLLTYLPPWLVLDHSSRGQIAQVLSKAVDPHMCETDVEAAAIGGRSYAIISISEQKREPGSLHCAPGTQTPKVVQPMRKEEGDVNHVDFNHIWDSTCG